MVTLVARGVRFAYDGGPEVLRGVDVRVEPGELVCVLGPNGAGKSTLLRLLAGLRRPDAGAVEVDGSSLGRLSSRARAERIAVVPQSLLALPESTVEEFTAQGRYAHRGAFGRARASDREAILRALEEADLTGLADRPLDELSGGQRQRALVARALAQDAPLVLVDEPTNSLDPRHQLDVFRLIAGFGCTGRAAVVVTHDLNLASQFATRVVLLDDGRVAAEGSVPDVLRPEVLRPVYGTALAFGSLPVAGLGEERPFVLPWE